MNKLEILIYRPKESLGATSIWLYCWTFSANSCREGPKALACAYVAQPSVLQPFASLWLRIVGVWKAVFPRVASKITENRNGRWLGCSDVGSADIPPLSPLWPQPSDPYRQVTLTSNGGGGQTEGREYGTASTFAGEPAGEREWNGEVYLYFQATL